MGGISAQTLAERQARWKNRCEQDQSIQEMELLISQYRNQHGEKCNIDDIAAQSGSESDIKTLFVGRHRREVLLAECGLARRGTAIIGLDGFQDPQQDEKAVPSSLAPPPGETFVTERRMEEMCNRIVAQMSELLVKQPPHPGPRSDK